MADVHHGDQVLLITEDENGMIGLQDVTNVQPTHGTRGVAPTLPENKLFHAFFSHSGEDNRWVRNVVERHESPEYGFHCCVSDRDFELGVPVFQNIVRSVLTSCKTVIVMSPEFLKSPWCSYEAQITMEQDIDLRRRLLVPVMLRECVVPEFIGRLTYMDVNNEHFWARFVAALQDIEGNMGNVVEPLGSQARFTALPFTFNPNFQNGELIKSLTAFQCCGCCRCGASPELESTFVPNELITRGMQVAPHEYAAVSQTLYTVSYIRYHCCNGSFITSVSAILLVIFSTVFLPIGIALNLTPTGTHIEDDGTQTTSELHPVGILLSRLHFILLFTLGVTMSVTLGVIILKLLLIFRFTRALKKSNELLYHRNIMVSSKDHGCWECNANKLTISFFYFEWRSCELYIHDFLEADPDIVRTLQPARNSNELLALPVTNLHQFAQSLLLDYSLEYGQLLVRHRLPVPAQQRHTGQGECMCQFVERNIHEPPVGRCVRRIFNSPTQHPLKMFYYL